jgi:hypothetical protein
MQTSMQPTVSVLSVSIVSRNSHGKSFSNGFASMAELDMWKHEQNLIIWRLGVYSLDVDLVEWRKIPLTRRSNCTSSMSVVQPASSVSF